jgi:hypothetical protein
VVVVVVVVVVVGGCARAWTAHERSMPQSEHANSL